MKLLILTQKVDKEDPILGFFHRWIEEFSKHFESVIVICLEKRKYDLPNNVRVLSLGKEKGKPKIEYLLRFYRYIWQERRNYDSVFVHMNQEYVLFAGDMWRLMGKKVTMWRNHHRGNILTRIAIMMCHKVFCTSRFSFTAPFKKTVLMPVGIDTSIFKKLSNVRRRENSILYIGRISPSKRIDILIKALGELKEKGVLFSTSIVGDSLPKDTSYYEEIQRIAEELGLSEDVKFLPGVPNFKTPEIYNAHEICVNLSSSGMYDKTIFEAALCGTLSLTSNENLRNVVDQRLFFEELSVENLAYKLEAILSSSSLEQELIAEEFYSFVCHNHSLKKLGTKLYLTLTEA